MPMFLVERSFAYELELSDDDLSNIREVGDMAGARWVASFLSADKRKTYCLYEAPSEEEIRRSIKFGLTPADAIIPVDQVYGAALAAAAQAESTEAPPG
jgi:hypothetical protein